MRYLMTKPIFILLLLPPLSALAREPYIDPYTLERNKEFSAVYKACLAQEFYAANRCAAKADRRFEDDYPRRGSVEYNEAYYADLTKTQGKAKADELKKLQLSARENVPRKSKKPGEITAGTLMLEKWWILENILELDPQRIYIRYE